MKNNSIVSNYYSSISNSWYKRVIWGTICLAAAYGFASWAIDSGSLLLYGVTIVLAYVGFANIFKASKLLLTKNGR